MTVLATGLSAGLAATAGFDLAAGIGFLTAAAGFLAALFWGAVLVAMARFVSI
jgi:hypothetical protein